MKKFSLVILFFVLNTNMTFAQCELNLKDILGSLLLNSTDFDTFALNKGFDYNSDLKKYVCLSKDKNFFSNVIGKSLEGDQLTITYLTHSKETYLINKSQIENSGFEFVTNQIVNNMNVFLYKHGNITATLGTETFDDVINYYVSVQMLVNN